MKLELTKEETQILKISLLLYKKKQVELSNINKENKIELKQISLIDDIFKKLKV